ncbi:general stress protein [Exiguobacterium alkaliphilum]|uniref:General stress protein n=1 Tax=Exiguobacterium alkaliphilum TaxID=1428684 RepID=A0ABT2KX48_9BACL|nr:general stress protein [Exiguobacterium alkaliphilum]MCT4795513.1 general stress protein [Exiguobacterium alkaliphilum]
MSDRKIIGLFSSEQEVMDQVDELRTAGEAEKNMHVVAKRDGEISALRYHTDVNAEAGIRDVNWLDRVKSFLHGSDRIRDELRNMGLSDAEAEEYYTAIDNGKLLLYVDKHSYERYPNMYKKDSELDHEKGEEADGIAFDAKPFNDHDEEPRGTKDDPIVRGHSGLEDHRRL